MTASERRLPAGQSLSAEDLMLGSSSRKQRCLSSRAVVRSTAPYCRTCHTYNTKIQRVYVRKANGRGYEPIGWLCRETGHARFDNPHPKPEADPVKIVHAGLDQEASMTLAAAIDARLRASDRQPDTPRIDERLLRLPPAVNNRRGRLHACPFCVGGFDCAEDH